MGRILILPPTLAFAGGSAGLRAGISAAGSSDMAGPEAGVPVGCQVASSPMEDKYLSLGFGLRFVRNHLVAMNLSELLK